MGEVYPSRDSKLGREVALKVLPSPVGIDPGRLARFSREAKVLAALNHPNIAAIYGLEDSGSTHARRQKFLRRWKAAIALGEPLRNAFPAHLV